MQYSISWQSDKGHALVGPKLENDHNVYFRWANEPLAVKHMQYSAVALQNPVSHYFWCQWGLEFLHTQDFHLDVVADSEETRQLCVLDICDAFWVSSIVVYTEYCTQQQAVYHCQKLLLQWWEQ